MFTVQALFLPQLYHSDKIDDRCLQKIIEEPKMHILGLSKSTTESGESFLSIRPQDLKLLSTQVTLPSLNIVLNLSS